MYAVGPGIWRENRKTRKIETHMVEQEIWQETLKNV